ncbi:MAG: DUF58 domain-containing protein [Verrucomicrobiales bacterium]|jgi:uncharacterized protein (DUF58 family)|nr:DUF58 domain-containing protein [Verrucomicrobiales bacterium]
MPRVTISEMLKKVRAIEIRTNRQVNEALAGQYRSVFRGSGIDFDEVREYVPGDDVRSIDWKVTARNGRPFVKKYREDRELTILLAIDVSASGNFGSGDESKRERAAELASVIAFSAIKNRDNVGLLLFSDRAELYIPPGKGRFHVLRVIREILFHEPQGRGTDIKLALENIRRTQKRRAVVFLISDFCLTGDYTAELESLRVRLNSVNRRHDLVAVSVSDPRETELPSVGRLTLEDAETGELVEVDTTSVTIRKKFAELSVRRAAELRRAFNGNAIDLVELTTDRPYLPVLRQFFRSREKRVRGS